MQSIASYVPGAHLNLPDIGGSQQIEQNYISVHGNGPTHDTYMLDGMSVNTTYLDGAIQQYMDNAAVQETTHTGEQRYGRGFSRRDVHESGSKDGGNQYHLNFFGRKRRRGFWQAGNLSPIRLARAA